MNNIWIDVWLAANPVFITMNGKQFPKQFPLETGKFVIKCLMERAWKLKELTFHSNTDDDLLEVLQILPLLSLSSSRFLSNLGLALSLRTPNEQVPQLISKFSQSLTVLDIREMVHDCTQRDNVMKDIFLTLAAAIGSCHKLETLTFHYMNQP